MIKSKTQSKAFIKKSSPSISPRFSFFRLVTIHLFAGFLAAALLINVLVSDNKSIAQTAEPEATEAGVTLFAESILPTQQPITEPALPQETIQNLNPTPAPTIPVEEPSEDFCLDIPVLVYHHIQPLQMASLLGHKQLTIDSPIFESQMSYLKENGYQAISAGDLVHALLNRQTLPEKSILITIDDGYDDNYTYAFMTAKKYQMVMNFMIPTKLIGKPGYMTWEHIQEMYANDYARIYNHTATHAPLGYMQIDQIRTELTTSTEDFKRELGDDVTIFTYPYGSYNQQAIELLKQHGFVGAFTTDDGRKQCISNIMQLQRTRIGNAPLSTYGF